MTIGVDVYSFDSEVLSRRVRHNPRVVSTLTRVPRSLRQEVTTQDGVLSVLNSRLLLHPDPSTGPPRHYHPKGHSGTHWDSFSVLENTESLEWTFYPSIICFEYPLTVRNHL